LKPVQLVFASRLNTVALRRDRLSKRWIQHRFRLWKQTALGSILRQTEEDWRYCLMCAAESRDVTEALRHEITDERVELIHVGQEIERWRAALPPAERYLIARLDSDDMYHPTAGANYLRLAARTRAARPYLQYNQGYAYDSKRRKLYRWKQPSSPFYARVTGPEYRTRGSNTLRDHTKIRPQALELGRGHFVVTLHAANTSTTRRCPYIGDELPRHHAKAIAAAFHLRI
jgi:hypothetical protein